MYYINLSGQDTERRWLSQFTASGKCPDSKDFNIMVTLGIPGRGTLARSPRPLVCSKRPSAPAFTWGTTESLALQGGQVGLEKHTNKRTDYICCRKLDMSRTLSMPMSALHVGG